MLGRAEIRLFRLGSKTAAPRCRPQSFRGSRYLKAAAAINALSKNEPFWSARL
jgi:hypothetical protein